MNLNKKEKELLMYCVLAFAIGYLICIYFPVHKEPLLEGHGLPNQHDYLETRDYQTLGTGQVMDWGTREVDVTEAAARQAHMAYDYAWEVGAGPLSPDSGWLAGQTGDPMEGTYGGPSVPHTAARDQEAGAAWGGATLMDDIRDGIRRGCMLEADSWPAGAAPANKPEPGGPKCKGDPDYRNALCVGPEQSTDGLFPCSAATDQTSCLSVTVTTTGGTAGCQYFPERFGYRTVADASGAVGAPTRSQGNEHADALNACYDEVLVAWASEVVASGLSGADAGVISGDFWKEKIEEAAAADPAAAQASGVTSCAGYVGGHADRDGRGVGARETFIQRQLDNWDVARDQALTAGQDLVTWETDNPRPMTRFQYAGAIKN